MPDEEVINNGKTMKGEERVLRNPCHWRSWKFSKRHTPFPPLHGPGGIAYSDFEKAEAFKDTLEVTFQENEEPYCDDKIEEVENLV
ncbi:uncharacterized protein TNCV_4200371 [Trichonephila clavipes]|uniref:Uncharacterized protein n=1 Tax=Trichonephila clavipes TaxID=2585209 RepID=A0A8X7BHU5_TRICX|nr:uncharacterized protein TNCV_4200371 [Trichonephila clavipes]